MSNTPSPAPKPKKVKLTGWPKWRRRLVRTAIGLVVAVVLFRMLLTLLLPTAIRRAAAYYGMDCEYDRSRLGLVGGYAALWNVKLTPTEGGQPVLQAGFCEASISTWALFSGHLLVWRVGADGVDANIYRDANGEIPLLKKIVAPPAKQAPPPTNAIAKELDLGAPFQVDAFRLNRVAINIKDESVSPPFIKTINVDVRVSDVGLADKPAKVDVFVQSDDLIEELRLSGEARTAGRVIDAQLRASGRGIQPKAALGYLSLLGIQPTGGEINFIGRATVKTAAVEKTLSALKGEVALHDLRVYNEHNDDVMRVGRVSITPSYLSTDRLDLGRVEIADVTTVVNRTPEAYVAFAGLAIGAARAATTQPIVAVPSAPAPVPSTSPAAAALPKISLTAFDVRNMRFVLNDTAVSGGASIALVVNHLDLENVATYAATQPAPITLSADLSAPKLASSITLKGSAYPFERDKKASLQFTMEGIKPDAIKPYLDAQGIESTYQAGRLNCEASALFRKTDTGDLYGTVTLRDLSLTDKGTLLKLADGKITDCTINPQTLDTHIGAVDISGPTLAAHRDSDGQIHLLGLKIMKATTGPAASAASASAPATAAIARAPATRPAATMQLPRFQLDRFTWKSIHVDFSDESVQPTTHYSMTDAGVELRQFVLDSRPTTRPASPATFSAWAAIPGLIDTAKVSGELLLQPGKTQVTSRADVQGINTKALAPYFPWDFQPTVGQGALSAKAGATFTSIGNITRFDADISDVSFTDSGKPLIGLDQLQVVNAQPGTSPIVVDSVHVVKPAFALAKNADQSIDYFGFHGITTQRRPLWDMFKKLPAPPDIQCNQLRVDQASVTWEDRSFAPAAVMPIKADVTLDNLQIGEIASPGKLSVRGTIAGAVESFGLDTTLNAGKEGYRADSRVWASGIHSGPLDAYLAPASISTRDGRAYAAVSAKLTNHEGGGLAGRIDVKDVLVQEGQTQRLAIEHITLNSSEMSQPTDKATIDELSITGIRASIQRLADGSFDVVAVRNAPGPVVYKPIPAPATQQALEATNTAQIIADARKTLPLISVAKFLISGTEIAFTDLARPTAAPIVIQDLQLHNANPLLWFGPKPAEQPANRYELSMKVNPVIDSLTLDLDLAAFAANPEAQLRVTASGIHGEGLAKVLPELTSMLDFSTLNDGQATMKLDTSLKVERHGPADFDFARGFTVDATMSGLQLSNAGEKRPLLGVQEVRANSARVEPNKHLITLPSLEIAKPVASVYRNAAGLRVAGITVKLPNAGPSTQPQSQGNVAAAPVPVPTEATTQPAAGPAPFDLQIRKLTISGLDVLYADTAFSPEVLVPLTQLDADISDIGTLSFKQPKPIRFNVLLGSGKVVVPKTSKSSAGEHDLFSLATANGAITLYPQPTGWVKASLNGLEMVAFEGAARSQKVDITNGLFDGELDLRITGAKSADVRAKGVLTDLSITEEPGGPIQSKLKLQVPLDSALKLIQDADGSISVPISFAITNGTISWDQLYASAASAAVSTITTAIASSPLKLASGLLGGGGQEQPKDAPKATIAFAPGDATLSGADVNALQDMIKRLNGDKNAQVTVRHILSESDESIAQARANPEASNANDLVTGLRVRKQELLREREQLLVQTDVLIASKPSSDIEKDLARVRELNREIHETDASLEKALDLFRPGADRQVNRRTRGACVSLGQARLDTVKAYLLSSGVKDIEKRMEVAPASGEVSPDASTGGVLITLVTRKR